MIVVEVGGMEDVKERLATVGHGRCWAPLDTHTENR